MDAASKKYTDNTALEKRLWDAADQFRANHEVLVAAESGQSDFEKGIDPLRRLVETFSERIQNLRRTRNLLLPRLLSRLLRFAENG